MSAIPPESLKPVAGYVKLANDTESRDPIIAYWIRVYVMQKALKIDSKSPEARSFLVNIMDRLEKVSDIQRLLFLLSNRSHFLSSYNRTKYL